MRKKSSAAEPIPRVIAADFEGFVGDLAMKFWNQLHGRPEFSGLEMKDFAVLFQALRHSLRPYWASPDDRMHSRH